MLASEEKYQYYKVYSKPRGNNQKPREIGVVKVPHHKYLQEVARYYLPVNSREMLLFDRIHNTSEGASRWNEQCREKMEFIEWMSAPAV